MSAQIIPMRRPFRIASAGTCAANAKRDVAGSLDGDIEGYPFPDADDSSVEANALRSFYRLRALMLAEGAR